MKDKLKETTEKLILANKELAFQNEEKAKRAAELIIANIELAFQNEEKAKRAAELVVANKELAFHNEEKAKRAAELVIANKELAFQNEEKAKRAAELVIANKELAFQNEEKEKRTAELVVANKELLFQNEEKAKRAAELVIANKELAFQNEEKEKQALELVIANKELAFQNEESEIKSEELNITNEELASQNEEKEKRATELVITNKELEQFSYLSSHDLREPLLTIRSFIGLILDEHSEEMNDEAKKYFQFVSDAAVRMDDLIKGLLDYSRLSAAKQLNDGIDCNEILKDLVADYNLLIIKTKAVITIEPLPIIKAFPLELKLLFGNLISNAIKFRKKEIVSEIHISYKKITAGWQFAVKDNGIGIGEKDKEKIFLIFQRLHKRKDYEGTGIGLAFCKKIAELHGGRIWVESILGESSHFYFTILTERL